MKIKFCIIITLITLLLSNTFVSVHAQSVDYPNYIIQDGESLGTIAEQFNVSVEDIITINDFDNPDLVSPGQLITIPTFKGVSGTLTPVTVGFSDSLTTLSEKFNSDINEIIKINHITNKSSIFIGTRLFVAEKGNLSDKKPLFVIEDGRVMLEYIAQKSKNPYLTILENNKSSLYDFYNGEIILGEISDEEISFNPISPLIQEFEINPLPLQQGNTISIHLLSKEPIELKGSLDDHVLNFYTTDNLNFYALQGIHAMADPGLTKLVLQGFSEENQIFKYENSLLLKSGYFDTDDPLTVDPETIDPKITKPEEEFILGITSKFSNEKYWSGLFISPAFYQEYNSLFGSRRTYNDDPETYFHTGVDFAGGMTLPIVAPADGKVVFAGPLTIRGNATIIDHGMGVYSGYYHQNQIFVKAGDTVTQGQKIGEVGNSGRVDRKNEYEGAGAHLHWEIWVNGVQVNPLQWLDTEYP